MPTLLRLLLIEDSDSDAVLLVHTIQRGGYEISFRRVDSSGALITALNEVAWDLIIADFSLPGFDTPAALRLVRERGLDVPFILVSGTIDQETAVRMMHAGAQDFVSKNNLARLLPIIARELREADERRARSAAEEALRRGEESFRLLFTTNPQPMWVYDRETLTFLEVNDVALTQYGYTRTEFLGMRLQDIQPLDTDPEPGAQDAAGQPRAGQRRHRLKDGRVIDVEIAVHTVQFAGHVAELVVAAKITERTRRLESRARLAALVESSDDAIIGESLDGIIESWNAGATRLYGYSDEEAIGRHISMLAPSDRVDEIPQLAARLKRGESLTHYDTVRVRKDGARVDVSFSLAPIRNGTGRIIGASTIARDMGDRLRAQHAVEQARVQAEELARLRADFVTSVSHELRTPLTSIVGYVDLLLTKWGDIPEAMRLDFAQRIADAAHRQVRLVEDLLLISRLEGQLPPPQYEAVELYPLLQQVARETEGNYHGQHIAMVGPRDLVVMADPVRVTQIMANLFDNAAKYSPEGRPIHVSWQREENWVAVRVRDQGSGISEQSQSLLFTRFGRVPESRMRAGHVGTGLGLFLARRLAQLMGGSLSLEDTGPTGSIFTLRLPFMADITPTAAL
jgi:PAS domain S-box-containing protein